jgi:GT2 family glycosyltransferase
LRKTLVSLRQYYLKKTANKVKVVLVDNDSSDDSVAMARAEFGWVEVVELEQNTGFAAANNVALKTAKTEYVMLLNTDTQLNEKNGIDEMIEYLEKHKDVGMIGPKLILTDGRIDPASHRGEPTLWAAASYFLGLEKLWPCNRFFSRYHKWYLAMDQTHEIDAISGAAMILPRRAVQQVGLLDESFFLYAEDLDWARRFRDAGYKVVYYPQAEITHHKNKSGIVNQDAKIQGKSRAYFYNTMLQYYDKYYSDKYPRWVRAVVKVAVSVKRERL